MSSSSAAGWRPDGRRSRPPAAALRWCSSTRAFSGPVASPPPADPITGGAARSRPPRDGGRGALCPQLRPRRARNGWRGSSRRRGGRCPSWRLIIRSPATAAAALTIRGCAGGIYARAAPLRGRSRRHHPRPSSGAGAAGAWRRSRCRSGGLCPDRPPAVAGTRRRRSAGDRRLRLPIRPDRQLQQYRRRLSDGGRGRGRTLRHGIFDRLLAVARLELDPAPSPIRRPASSMPRAPSWTYRRRCPERRI